MVAITPSVLVVALVVAAALVLFATEVVPVDVTALGVLVALLVVSEGSQYLATLGVIAGPVVLVTPQEGISGFASTATITVLAMFILSDGVQRTGIVAILGRKMAAFTRDDENRQLGVTMGVVAPVSGFINNTAAVAILLPMVTDLAHKGKTSPSKLLIPLSYASMFGGTLTLIGTSTNILASDIAATLHVPNDPVFTGLEGGFSMFEFTALGAIVTVTGFAYFFTIGRYLLPERIPAKADLTTEFGLADYLTEVEVRADSPIVGQSVRDALVDTHLDVDVVQLVRGDRTYLEPLGPKTIQAGDVFAVRTDRDTLVDLMDADGLDLHADVVDDTELQTANDRENLVEVVVAPGSSLVNETLTTIRFRQRYDATVLALRRGDELVRQRMDDIRLRIGDTLLVQGTPETIERMDANRDFIVAQEIERTDWRTTRIPVALAIVAGVVGFAAAGILPIVVSALTGALAMILTGCLKPSEIYDAVQWDVIVLLAGVIPLGIAMETSGTAAIVADTLVTASDVLPGIVLLGAFYVVTAALTNVISNNASVVLMLPVAAEAAIAMNAWAYPYILAVTFAASTAFMTPVGYQTNLFVYGPGGYKFTDYLKVGTPLQAIFAVVTTLGIYYLWGLTPPA